MFDFSGRKLPSLDVFKYARTGAVGPKLQVIWTDSPNIEIGIGEKITLPDTVEAMYNDSSKKDPVSVTWEEYSAYDTNSAATYDIVGVCNNEDATKVHATGKVSNVNYVTNADFETGDLEGWESDGPTDNQDKAADSLSVSHAAHFYSTEAMENNGN